jgi:hypothetical protein
MLVMAVMMKSKGRQALVDRLTLSRRRLYARRFGVPSRRSAVRTCLFFGCLDAGSDFLALRLGQLLSRAFFGQRDSVLSRARLPRTLRRGLTLSRWQRRKGHQGAGDHSD